MLQNETTNATLETWRAKAKSQEQRSPYLCLIPLGRLDLKSKDEYKYEEYLKQILGDGAENFVACGQEVPSPGWPADVLRRRSATPLTMFMLCPEISNTSRLSK